MFNMQKLSILIACLVLGACSQLNPLRAYLTDSVLINGKVYPVENGNIVLTPAQLKELQRDREVVIATQVSPQKSLHLTSDELSVLLEDKEALFAALDSERAQNVAALIQQGSLKESITNFLEQQGWSNVDWSTELDFYVSSPYILKGPDVASVIMSAVSRYPGLYANIDETSQRVSISQQ